MKLALRRGAVAFAFCIAVLLILVASALLYFTYITHTGVAATTGTQSGLPLDAPVTIARDNRGIPHVRARTDHDLFFAEGYAMAADRLFQMDLTRRYTEGRIAELLGAPLVHTDAMMRAYDIERLAGIQYAHIPVDERHALDAFAAGINAAAAREPQPPEYNVLFTRFRAWHAQDTIEVGYATLIDLDDDATAIVARDAIHRRLGMAGTDFFLPLTDPRYDVPTNGAPSGKISKLPDAPPGRVSASNQLHTNNRAPVSVDDRTTIGSNGWVVGANRTTVRRAILANDPHLSLSIPGVWWLFEGRSPGYHIAGAVLAGTIGVTLGHNEHVAWGVTAGETAAMRLVREPFRGTDQFFEHGRWVHAIHHSTTIDSRFGAPTRIEILTTPNGTLIARDGTSAYLRDWLAARSIEDPFAAFLGLDRSASVDAALGAMHDLPEPALNLLAADDTGRATYHLVGGIPNENVWSRWAVDGNSLEPPLVPFARVPHVDPSRDALIVTSNNRAAGAGSLRLAPFWPSPYRANEVHRMLSDAARANAGMLTPQAIAAPQSDLRSPAERELAQLVVAAAVRQHAQADPAVATAIEELRTFDGSFRPDSRAATLLAAMRPFFYRTLTASLPPAIAAAYIAHSTSLTVPLRALRERPRGWVANWDRFAVDALRAAITRVGTPTPPFGTWAAQELRHPLAPFGLRAWNGPTLPGQGGAYAPAVQNAGHGQSFRAQWIVGDWDASTIDIDAGESGEPGSPHYTDQSAAWQRFARTPLAFSDAAVRAATQSTLTLQP